MNLENKITGIWPNLFRAYEVALLSGQKIKLTHAKNYKKYYEDLPMIKTYLGDVYSTSGQISIEIESPNFDRINSGKYESIQDILNRVNLAKENKQPSDKLNNSCTQLLKTAFERLQMGLNDYIDVTERALAIAKLENSDKIEAYHIAESIQYCGLTFLE